MLNFTHFVSLFTLVLSGAVCAEYTPDAKTIKLVDCGHVMAYAANYALANNNEGQARLLSYQYARALVALFSENYDRGTISGERTSAWKARTPATKRYLDANQASLPKIVDGCYPIIQRAVDDPIVRSTKMWGYSFEENVEQMAAKYRSLYGLR